MTDFKNLTTTTELALRALFKDIYKYIPRRYRLKYDPEVVTEHIHEFYDPELTLDDRLTYKIARIPYEDRQEPWIALLWSTEGVQRSEDMGRRFDAYSIRTDKSGAAKMKVRQVQTPVSLSFVSNSLTAMLELQEVVQLNSSEHSPVIAMNHPIMGDFVTNVMNISWGTLAKLPRNKGTVCTYSASVVLNYPVIGQYDGNVGIITTINTNYIDSVTGDSFTDTIQPENN